jgi:hypothetical protein
MPLYRSPSRTPFLLQTVSAAVFLQSQCDRRVRWVSNVTESSDYR